MMPSWQNNIKKSVPFGTLFFVIQVALSAVEILDLLGAAGVAQLADGLIFDLADTLTGNAKDLAHFLQGVGAAVVHTEAHTQHISLTLGQRVQDLLQCLGKQGIGGCVSGAGGTLVFDEGTDGGIFFVTDGGIQGQGVRSGAVRC